MSRYVRCPACLWRPGSLVPRDPGCPMCAGKRLYPVPTTTVTATDRTADVDLHN